MRLVVIELKNPVALYSVGKDPRGMPHVAMRAFNPTPLPFSVRRVDTAWKFLEFIADETARQPARNPIVYCETLES